MRTINKDTMVLIWFDITKKMRICIRNKWSKHFNNFPLLTLQKVCWLTNDPGKRIEYRFGLIGIEFVLMIFIK